MRWRHESTSPRSLQAGCRALHTCHSTGGTLGDGQANALRQGRAALASSSSTSQRSAWTTCAQRVDHHSPPSLSQLVSPPDGFRCRGRRCRGALPLREPAQTEQNSPDATASRPSAQKQRANRRALAANVRSAAAMAAEPCGRPTPSGAKPKQHGAPWRTAPAAAPQRLRCRNCIMRWASHDAGGVPAKALRAMLGLDAVQQRRVGVRQLPAPHVRVRRHARRVRGLRCTRGQRRA